MRLFSLFSFHLLAASLSLTVAFSAKALDVSAPPVEAQADQNQELLQGAQAYFEGVNLRGGIHGRPIHLTNTQFSSVTSDALSFSQGTKVSSGSELQGSAPGSGTLYDVRPEFDAQVSRMVDQLFELNAQGSSAIDHRKVFAEPLRKTMQTTANRVGMVREYEDAMKTAGYQTRSAWSLEGYINAKVIAEGLRRAGRTVVSSLDNSRNYDLGGIVVAVGIRSTQPVRIAALGTAQRLLNF